MKSLPIIKILPFIEFLRKSGLEVSIEESILSQSVINLSKFSVSSKKLRQSLKTVIIRRRAEYEIFDSCFDIYFRHHFSISDQEGLGIRISNQMQKGESEEFIAKAQSDNSDNDQSIPGLPGSQNDTNFQGDGRGLELESEDFFLLKDVLDKYKRWLPDSLKHYAHLLIVESEENWQNSIEEFIQLIFGFGQYKHTQTIAERYNRFSNQFTNAYIQMLQEIKINNDFNTQIIFFEQLEYLKVKIENFLRKTRLKILQLEQIDASQLLRHLYSSFYIPGVKNFLTDDFNRIEGDLLKVQQHLLLLGKKIAILERKKRIKAQKGKINFRKTFRNNISTGGNLINVVYHKKKRKDPKIILLSDISGSTEWVSEFFFVISYAAQSTFKKLSLFEFDSTTVEITAGLNSPTLSQALLKRIQCWENPIRSRSGHSNYQTAFQDFMLLATKYLTKNTTIIILGDCRDWLGGYKQISNGSYEPESKIILEKISKRVKRIIILNPEPKNRWNTGDSIVSHFEKVAKIHSVENIMDILNFIFKQDWNS